MYISAVILQNGQSYFLKINLKHVWNTWYGGDRYNRFFFFGGGGAFNASPCSLHSLKYQNHIDYKMCNFTKTVYSPKVCSLTSCWQIFIVIRF